MSHLLLAATVLTLYLALHALHCIGDHEHRGVLHVVAHSVGSEHSHDHERHDYHLTDHPADHPVDHCDTGHGPTTSRPHCLAAPRAAENGGVALSSAPLLFLAGLGPATDLWRTRQPGRGSPRKHCSGRDVLHALCVSRR